MEIYDIVMIVVLVGATIFGAFKGFAWQLASIASIVISYTVAYKYREPFSQSIQAEPPWNRFLAMLILFIGTSLVIWVAFRMISGTIDRLRLREFDRQVGALFGFAKGALYCILITLFSVTLMGDEVREKIVRSKSGNYIANVLHRSEAVIPAEIQGVVKPYLDRFDERFNQPEDPGQSWQTPWTASESYGSTPSANWGPTNGGVSGYAAAPYGTPGSALPPTSGRAFPSSGQGIGYRPSAGLWDPATQQAQQPSWNGLQR
jgi:membrane protein required for colicin V production